VPICFLLKWGFEAQKFHKSQHYFFVYLKDALLSRAVHQGRATLGSWLAGAEDKHQGGQKYAAPTGADLHTYALLVYVFQMYPDAKPQAIVSNSSFYGN